MAQTLVDDSRWVLCRNFQAIPVPAIDVLPAWVERGRLLPDDFLANSALDVCLQARDVPELNDVFRRTRRGPLQAIVTFCEHLCGAPRTSAPSASPRAHAFTA